MNFHPFGFWFLSHASTASLWNRQCRPTFWAGSVGYVRTRIANTKVNDALTGESRQRQKAEATTQLALEALDDIFKQFAPERMSEFAELSLDDSSGSQIQVPAEPVLSKEAASLLEHLLAFYDRLAA